MRDLPLAEEVTIAGEEDVAPVLHAIVVGGVEPSSFSDRLWSHVFRDGPSTGLAMRELFPDYEVAVDPNATRRLRLLRFIVEDTNIKRFVWRSLDDLALAADVSDEDFFTFAAGLAVDNRGLPESADRLCPRFIRSLESQDALVVLEAMCAGNFGGSRALAQFELQDLNDWFEQDGGSLPDSHQERIRVALFEVGFRGNAT